MKRHIGVLLAVFCIVLLSTGCASGDSGKVSSDSSGGTSAQSTTVDAAEGEAKDPTQTSDANILVVYFSQPETTDPNNMTQDEDNSVVVIDGEMLGNTQYVAQLIAQTTGGDLFRIEPKTAYPVDHDVLVDLAKQEQNDNARPELAALVDNIDQYDTIFLGYPNWWADMPMVLYTFLEQHDLSGKTIIPFNTHGGSGFSRTISTIAELQPNATVDQNGFTVSRDNVEDSADDVVSWLKEHGFVA